MKLFKILSERKYFLAVVVSAIIMLVGFPLFQSLGNPQIWFTFIKPLNFALCLVCSVLFGIPLAVQYYSFKQKQQSCEIKSASANAGTILGLFAFQCPACVPVLAQALGLGAVTFLSVYRTQLIIVGIGLMLVSLYLLGAFKPDAQV